MMTMQEYINLLWQEREAWEAWRDECARQSRRIHPDYAAVKEAHRRLREVQEQLWRAAA